MDGLIIAAFIVFALLGAPLFAVFGGAALILFAKLSDTPITGAASDIFSEKFADNPTLVTVPLFTFAGYLMAESGTPRRLVEVSRAWLGWMPGSLAIVCIAASAFFTSFTGGSGITIVAIGGLLYPALLTDRYPEKFSLGLVTTSGSLGLLFPPSLPMILYGVVAGILIEKLFLAGLVPGIITVLALGGYAIRVGLRSKLPRTPFQINNALSALWEAKWEVLLPVVVLGGLYTGLVRIHEAAAFTAIYVLIIEFFVYRDVRFRTDMPRIIRESMTLVGAILIIMAAAVGFTAYLIQAQVPLKILAAMETVIETPWLFLLVLNVFLIATGMLIDIFSAIVVVVPLIVPIGAHFGIDPYHLAVVFLLNLEIGYMTPPVGLNLFISSFRFGKPVTVIYRSVLPFIGLLAVALVLTTYVAPLSTTLPGLIEQKGIIRDYGSSSDKPSGIGDLEESGPDKAPTKKPTKGAKKPGLTLDDLGGSDGGVDAGGGTLTLDDLGGPDAGAGGGDGERTLDDLESPDAGAGGAADEGDKKNQDDEVTLDDL